MSQQARSRQSESAGPAVQSTGLFSSQGSEPHDESKTPKYAVWLSLGFILLLGLYGLKLGMKATSPAKPAPEKTSSSQLVPTTPVSGAEGSTFA